MILTSVFTIILDILQEIDWNFRCYQTISVFSMMMMMTAMMVNDDLIICMTVKMMAHSLTKWVRLCRSIAHRSINIRPKIIINHSGKRLMSMKMQLNPIYNYTGHVIKKCKGLVWYGWQVEILGDPIMFPNRSDFTPLSHLKFVVVLN